MSAEFIRDAIADGELVAEDILLNQRRLIRIHADDFRRYLLKIGWSRIPRE